jgi:hypothetical protein
MPFHGVAYMQGSVTYLFIATKFLLGDPKGRERLCIVLLTICGKCEISVWIKPGKYIEI